MENKDIRWIQRFSNYRKALGKLEETVTGRKLEELSDLEKEGLIQRFEYTYELAWKTLQDLLKHKGFENIVGPNAVLRQALKEGYITEADDWRDLKKAREATSHTYNSEVSEAIGRQIFSTFYTLLKNLETKLMGEKGNTPEQRI